MNPKSVVSLALVVVLCLPGGTGASEEGPGFDAQGEYVGTLKGLGKIGVQVMALGKGQFRALLYRGGLPGEGWDPAGKVDVLKGGTKEDTTVLAAEEGDLRVTIRDGALEVSRASGGSGLGRLPRVVRKSKTLGKKPPRGALVLFDGTTAENFLRGDPRNPDRAQPAPMTEDKLLMVGPPHGGHLFSKKGFQSCLLHLEFRLPYMPEARGQGRGNSGCYLQGRYEVQILDSFGLTLEEIKSGDCGGIYSIAKPRVNLCYPPLGWQTYDIEFTAARFEGKEKRSNPRMTVHHNGVLIHDNVEIADRPNGTTAAPFGESPDPGPVYLQDHGSPLRYRNIWLVEK